jgi:hypothetical protein
MMRRSENILWGIALVGLCLGCSEDAAVADERITATDDTSAVEEPVFFVRSTYHGPYMLDSAELSRLDTSAAAGKRRWRIHQFCWDHSPSGPLCDTLLDVNYDGHLDHVLGGYGSTGTGIKYFWEVYTWDQGAGRYRTDTTLSRLPNPTFFPKDSTVTSFYLGHGAGHGKRFKWIDGRWQLDMSFWAMNNDMDSTWWHIEYPLKARTDSVLLPYQDVPPRTIMDYRTE